MTTESQPDFNLLAETRKLLKERNSIISLSFISKRTGLNYNWLSKFSQNMDIEPGINKVQTLYDFLKTLNILDLA